jgi:BolA protein
MSTIADRLAADLRTALAAEHVEIHDESARHRGHAGALEGGHFDVTVVSSQFAGLGPVERHRAVYAALGDLRARRVHALALKTFTPDEWRGAQA